MIAPFSCAGVGLAWWLPYVVLSSQQSWSAEAGCWIVGRSPSVRVHDRAQHDPARVWPVVAGAAVHCRALVPYEDIADAPAVVIDEALLGRVIGELLDEWPRPLPVSCRRNHAYAWD